jgi:hypothetical protein
MKKEIVKNKRGMEMAFGTVVTIVLALLLLAFLIVFFTGNFSNFKDKIGGFFSSSNVDDVVSNCNSLVLRESKYEYCCTNKTVKLSSKNKFESSCNDLSLGNFSWAKNIEKLNCLDVC